MAGTAVTLTLNSKARKIHAIINVGSDPTYTTAEGGASVIRLNSTSIQGLANRDFLSGPVTTSGPATNSSGQGMIQDIIPLDLDVSGNEDIDVSAYPTTTLTTARLHEVGILYSDGSVPSDWLMKFPNPLPMKGADEVNASQLTTTETGLTAITVPSWAKALVAVRPIVHKTGAITAAEEVQGFFRLTSTIADFGVQEFPTNALGATLGTPVGTGMYHDRIPPWIPIYIPTTGKNESVTPAINLRTAVTTANRVTFGLAWR